MLNDDIAELGGRLIIEKSGFDANRYCAYTPLASKKAWLCIEFGKTIETTIDPSITCRAGSYTCP